MVSLHVVMLTLLAELVKNCYGKAMFQPVPTVGWCNKSPVAFITLQQKFYIKKRTSHYYAGKAEEGKEQLYRGSGVFLGFFCVFDIAAVAKGLTFTAMQKYQ